MVTASLESLELPHQLPCSFLPVPTLAARWFGFLLVAAADSLHLLGHWADDFKPGGILVAAELCLHSNVDEHLPRQRHKSKVSAEQLRVKMRDKEPLGCS